MACRRTCNLWVPNQRVVTVRDFTWHEAGSSCKCTHASTSSNTPLAAHGGALRQKYARHVANTALLLPRAARRAPTEALKVEGRGSLTRKKRTWATGSSWSSSRLVALGLAFVVGGRCYEHSGALLAPPHFQRAHPPRPPANWPECDRCWPTPALTGEAHAAVILCWGHQVWCRRKSWQRH